MRIGRIRLRKSTKRIIGVVSRGIHITGMSRVSILDKFPVAGIISDDVPTPRKYPARMVGAVTSDVRAAGVTTFATTTDPSRAPCNRRTTEGRERNLLIRTRETPVFHFLLVIRLRRRLRQSVFP